MPKMFLCFCVPCWQAALQQIQIDVKFVAKKKVSP